MRRLFLVLALATSASVPFASPALAQDRAAEARLDAAQQRFDRELSLYRQELDRYRQSRTSYQGQYDGQYRDPRNNDPRYQQGQYQDDRYENGYDPSRYYRDGSNYQERTLAADDRVYRGTDGRYYCKRNDGTTGLVIGAAGGGILGNVIDGGHSRVVGTLIGGALGAIAGKAVDQSGSVNNAVRCR